MKYCVNVSCKILDQMVTRFVNRNYLNFEMKSIFGGIRLVSNDVKFDIFGKEMSNSEGLEIKRFSEIRDFLIA